MQGNIPFESIFEFFLHRDILSRDWMQTSTLNPNIVYLDWKNKEHVDAVSRLHSALLPESIVSQLGFWFVSKFYYKELTKIGLIDVYLYKHKGEYVGFIACTNRPFTFMRAGLRQRFLSTAVALGISILQKPARLLILYKMKGATPVKALQARFGDRIGQFLSFGVLEDCRRIVDGVEGTSIANVLMKLVFTHFSANKKPNFFLLVLKSNLRAIRFYEKHRGIVAPPDGDEESVAVLFSP